jgi:hypothetical protein
MPRKNRLAAPETPELAAPACNGTRVAYDQDPKYSREPHPVGNPRWPDCWKCNMPLGCVVCSTSNVREVLCARCAAWGTKDAFHHHGPIMNDEASVRKRWGLRAPEYREYPDAWKVGYEAPRLAVASIGDLVKTAMGEEQWK